MKKLVFVCGPNGVGKSTTCQRLNERLLYSARVDSDWCRCINPMEFSAELIALNERNLTALLTNYLACDYVQCVIFSYGLHGPRKQILGRVISSLSMLDFEFLPVVLTCDREENARRMKQQGRDDERIARALTNSRAVYDDLPYPRIDTTNLTVDEVVDWICEHLQQRASADRRADGISREVPPACSPAERRAGADGAEPVR